MALVSSGGPVNTESDASLASTGSLTATRLAGNRNIKIVSITCGPISTAAGAQCGHVSLRDGTTVLWRGYVFFTATLTAQSQSVTFPIGAVYKPVTDANVLYTAVTNATTASVALIWS
jgi:hypothetical protein